MMSKEGKNVDGPDHDNLPAGEELDTNQKSQLDDFFGSMMKPEDTQGKKAKDAAPLLPEDDEEEELERGTFEFEAAEDEEEEFEEEEAEETEEVAEAETSSEDNEVLIALKAEIANLNKQIQSINKKEEAPEMELPKIEVDLESLVTEEEAEQLLSDPREVMQKVLARVYTKAREDMLKDIPTLVETTHRRQQALTDARRAFWAAHPSLKERVDKQPAIRRLLEITVNEIQAENADLTVEQIFSLAGTQVETALGIAEEAQKVESEVVKGEKKKPNQPSKPRGKRRSPKDATDEPSGLQKQLNDMVQALAR